MLAAVIIAQVLLSAQNGILVLHLVVEWQEGRLLTGMGVLRWIPSLPLVSQVSDGRAQWVVGGAPRSEHLGGAPFMQQ